ncbi:MAG: arginyl-tRNA synthetase [Chloroflexota bacterium]|nr:arginyl-tRNA synthetase [Chloroflexota bacterium]
MKTPPTPRRAVAEWARPAVDGFLAGLDPEARPAMTVQRPARPEHGDLAISLPLQLARPTGRKPMDIAADLAAALRPGGPVASVEVAPPGFVNVRLDPAWMFDALEEVVAAGPDWGRLEFGAGRTAQVEFVSTNPTGPLLFSHGRGAVVGDTVARLLAFTGHEVQREFYLNDAGRQVQLFGESILASRLGQPAPEEGYAGEYIADYAGELPAEVLAAAESGGEAASGVAEWAMARSVAEFRRDLDALGIGFDRWFSERSLYGDWEAETIAMLEATGAISRHDGATWLRLDEDTEDVLYKSSGEPTYFMADILYHRDKLVRRGFDRAIDIWGADHQNQVRRVKDVLALMGVDPDRFQVVLIQLVRMKRGDEFVKISKRAGNLILLRDLVEEVGADAVRYHYLLRSTDAPMDFDVELARRHSNENPVFYAQMAHARLSSVRAVGAEAGLTASAAALGGLGAIGEVDLARELLEFPDVVEEAARNLEPHHLPHYAQRLAERIHTFYHAGAKDPGLRVVGEDRELSEARLHLCEAARLTMANALGLMGVAAPDRM